MKNFLDFKKLSVKEHFDIIANSTDQNPPFGFISTASSLHQNVFKLDNFTIQKSTYDPDDTGKFSYHIDDNDCGVYSYSLCGSNNYESYSSEYYNYHKDHYQDEITYKEFTLGDVRYQKSHYDREVQYKSTTSTMRYVRSTKNFMYRTDTIYSDYKSYEDRNFQYTEYRKPNGTIYKSELEVVRKTDHEHFSGFKVMRLNTTLLDTGDIHVELKWGYDDRVQFNMYAPDASVMHLFNPMYTFQVGLTMSTEEYTHFHDTLDAFEKELRRNHDQLPVISTMLHNIEVTKNS